MIYRIIKIVENKFVYENIPVIYMIEYEIDLSDTII